MEENHEQFDVEEFLLGGSENKDQAEFMMRNKGALERLNSIRLDSRMSSSRLS